MDEQTTDLPSSARAGRPAGMTAALALWLVGQVVAIALAAGRVPLTVAHPRPPELWVVDMVLVVQVLVGSALFTGLLGTWRQAAVVVATAWPMLELAALVSGDWPSRLTAAGAYISVWLAALYIAQRSLRTHYGRMFAVTTMLMLSVSGALCVYLEAEFGGGHGTAGTGAWSPLTGAIAVVCDSAGASRAWMWMVGYVALSIAAVIVRRVMGHRRVRRGTAPSTGYPPPVIHGCGK